MQNEKWETLKFKDVKVGEIFWIGEYEMFKYSDDTGMFSGDIAAIHPDTEVGILTLEE